MGSLWVVNHGVDTLVLNAFYTGGYSKPLKVDLPDALRSQLDAWKRAAQEAHSDYPTSLVFNGAVLHMCPNGVGQGQWPWMLKTPDITLYISGGHWNGIASIRCSSQYLWSSPGVLWVVKQLQGFLDAVFVDTMYLQVSSVDLCADVAGWQDIDALDRATNFVTRSRKRGVYTEVDWVEGMASREYTLGLQRTGFDFGRGKRPGSVSCRLYDKTRELRTSDKQWFFDLWRAHGWSESDGPVWRVEFSVKREALHEVLQENPVGEMCFHGIEDAYELPGLLPVLWAYLAGQVEGGPDGLPDGWLRCVLPGADSNRSRWPTHPAWREVQRAFLVEQDVPPQFGKIVRKRWEDHNINKGIEAVVGYFTTLGAWEGGKLATAETDLSTVLHWFAEKAQAYLIRVDRDFGAEIVRKRIRFGLGTGQEARRDGDA